MAAIIFYNVPGDRTGEISDFIKSRDSDTSILRSDFIGDVRGLIDGVDRAVVVFMEGTGVGGDIRGVRENLRGVKSLLVYFVKLGDDIDGMNLFILSRLRGLEKLNIRPRNLRLKSGFNPEKKMSRREILNVSKLVETGYVIVPCVSDLCNAKNGCDLCVKSCRFDALFVREKAHVTKELCIGCGICTAVCPSNAIEFPPVDLVNTGLETLAGESTGPAKKPKIISVCCEQLCGDVGESNFLALNVPCIGMIPVFQIIKAFALGVDGILLNCRDCPHGIELNLDDTVGFIRGFLTKLGLEGERIALNNFTVELTPRSDRKSFDGESPEELIPKLVEEFKVVGRIKGAPFGFLYVDRKCTFCGLCVQACPRNALTFKGGGDTVELIFEHLLCVGCGLCKSTCPENAIEFERLLDFENLRKVLAVDEQVLCISCGRVIASKRLYDKIGNRLAYADYLGYCPACRIVKRLSVRYS